MKLYRMRFSVRTSVTTVHADTCSSAAFSARHPGRPVDSLGGLLLGTHDKGDSIWQVSADSAEQAAADQEAQFKAEDRKMPPVKVCGCCKAPPSKRNKAT